MNAYETWFCGTRLWRWMTRRQVLPWVLQGSALGEHVLELGAGAGAATVELARRAPRVTSLEYDHALAVKLSNSVSRSTNHPSVSIIQGDAAALPFPDATFSSVLAILMLHHLKSIEWQDRAFSEVYRVLRRGGVFLAFDIPDGWFHRAGHIKSTFVPLDPATASQRLMAAGLSKVIMDSRSGGFRIRALRVE
jgi:ubiquinone/menaquinone biosynthesis C-methylase UbiE